MLNRRGFTAVAVSFLAGCGKPPAPPVARRAEASQEKFLTEADIARFFEVIEVLPGRKPPMFQPAAELDLSTDTGAASMVARWQREFRSAYSPVIQGKMWRRDADLRQALEEQGLEPEDLARLLVKLSTAVVRESLDPQIDLRIVGAQADHAIESLCKQLDGLDHDRKLSPSLRNGRVEVLTLVLKESVAYREFLRLLEAVPEESLATAARHRQALRALLPANDTVQAFERRLESQAAVIPAGYTAPASRQNQR